MSFDAHGARIGLQHAQNHVDGGGLSRAIRAQQPHDLVAVNREGNPVHRNRIAVLFAQLCNGEDRRRRGRL